MIKQKAISIAYSWLLLISMFSFTGQVFAQGLPIAPTLTPTPFSKPTTPTPGVGVALPIEEPHKSVANCDLCGYCQGVAKVPGKWQSCVKCLYPGTVIEGVVPEASSLATLTTPEGTIPIPDPNHFYTGFGCLSTLPGEFTAQMSSLFFSLIGGIAFLSFIYGAAVVATARSDAARLNQGRRIIIGSVVGLIFALLSVFIIQFLARSLGLPALQ